MIADLKPYPAMKDSGVPWLGKVPEHWEVRRGKWLFRHRKHINSDRANSNVLSLTLRGVVNNDPDNPEGLVPKDYATYQLFRKGDLVFKLIDLENLKTSRVGLVHEDGIMSSAYVRLIPHSIGDIRFFFQQYFDLYQRGIYNQLGAGVRSTLGSSDLLNLNVVVPAPPEQTAIVRFLDHADRRIRRYILAKQTLIKLLEEQKQAIIHHAVIRGVDPNVRLKPSGVEWLGDIPQHWEVRRLKSLVTESVAGPYGSSLTKSMYTKIGYRVYGQQQVISDDFAIGDYYISPDQFEAMQRYQVFAGDLLVSVMGTIGKVAVVPDSADPGIINPRLVRYRSEITAARPRWLELVMQDGAAQAQLSEASKGTTMDGLNMRILGKLLLLKPPLVEQDIILEHVAKERRPFTIAISRLEREIELLREYRTRLIADVVTGKLDVREAAAKLPEETHESGPLDDEEALADGDEETEGVDLDAVTEEAEA